MLASQIKLNELLLAEEQQRRRETNEDESYDADTETNQTDAQLNLQLTNLRLAEEAATESDAMEVASVPCPVPVAALPAESSEKLVDLLDTLQTAALQSAPMIEVPDSSSEEYDDPMSRCSSRDGWQYSEAYKAFEVQIGRKGPFAPDDAEHPAFLKFKKEYKAMERKREASASNKEKERRQKAERIWVSPDRRSPDTQRAIETAAAGQAADETPASAPVAEKSDKIVTKRKAVLEAAGAEAPDVSTWKQDKAGLIPKASTDTPTDAVAPRPDGASASAASSSASPAPAQACKSSRVVSALVQANIERNKGDQIGTNPQGLPGYSNG